jgi:hypothetical protein
MKAQYCVVIFLITSLVHTSDKNTGNRRFGTLRIAPGQRESDRGPGQLSRHGEVSPLVAAAKNFLSPVSEETGPDYYTDSSSSAATPPGDSLDQFFEEIARAQAPAASQRKRPHRRAHAVSRKQSNLLSPESKNRLSQMLGCKRETVESVDLLLLTPGAVSLEEMAKLLGFSEQDKKDSVWFQRRKMYLAKKAAALQGGGGGGR